MSMYSEKGYFVKENAPVYLTLDMDKTAKWSCSLGVERPAV